MEREDLILPRYLRKEQLSKFDPEGVVPDGEFALNINITRHKKVIDAVLLTYRKGRALFSKKGELLCASNDGKAPREEFKGTYAEECAHCLKSKWGPNRERPECPIGYNFLGVDVDEDNMPFLLSVRGSSIKHVKRLLTEIKLRFKGPLLTRPVVISSIGPISGEIGSWYETTMTIDEESDYDWRPYYQLFQDLKDLEITPETDQTTEDDTAEEVGEVEGEGESIPV
jgi:hypothetical protein